MYPLVRVSGRVVGCQIRSECEAFANPQIARQLQRVLGVAARLRSDTRGIVTLGLLTSACPRHNSVSQSTWPCIISTWKARPIERREVVMKKWGRRIRGAIGMGLAWGAAGFGAGILLARVPSFDSDLPFALLFAPLGFFAGIIFSGILVAIGKRRGFDRMSLSRFAGWGAVSGLLLSGVFAVGAALRGQSLWGEFLVFGPGLAIASAVSAAGSLALARRAEMRELPGPSGNPAELEPNEEETRELLGRGD
jgi:hypothetical protein